MIRDACPDDIQTIMHLMQSANLEDIGYRDCKQDPAYVRCSLMLMLNSPSVRIFLDDAGRGLLVAQATQDWFTPRIRVAEEVLYVHPAHRGGTLAWRLIRRLEEWAKEMQASYIVAGVSSGSDIAVKLYGRAGYTDLGRTLVKRLGDM